MTQQFEAILEKPDDVQGAYITVPFNVHDIFGSKAMIRVRGTVDGVPYRNSIAPMGGGVHVMIVKKDIRDAIGKTIGDTVAITMDIDTEERVVVVPDDFQQALEQNPAVLEVFNKFAYSHRREYVEWIESAKKPETRQNRIEKAVKQIASGGKFS